MSRARASSRSRREASRSGGACACRAAPSRRSCVYVNGVQQSEGADYRLRGGEIVFSRPIVKEGRSAAMRWLAMLLGLFGTYRKHETVDVEYRLGGQVKLASDVEILPD